MLRVAILYDRKPCPLVQCLREFRLLSAERPAGLRASMAVASCLLQLGRFDDYTAEAERYFAVCPGGPLGDRVSEHGAWREYRREFDLVRSWSVDPQEYLRRWHAQIGLPQHYFKRPDAEVYLAVWLTLRAFGLRPTLKELRARVKPHKSIVDPLRLAETLAGYGFDVTYQGEGEDWSSEERALRKKLARKVTFREAEPLATLLKESQDDAFVWVGYGFVDYLALSPLQAERDGRVFLPFHSDIGWLERAEFDRVWAGPGAYREAILCDLKKA